MRPNLLKSNQQKASPRKKRNEKKLMIMKKLSIINISTQKSIKKNRSRKKHH